MKIKHQVVILLCVIIIIPILVAGIIFLNKYLDKPELSYVPGYNEIIEVTGSDITQDDWNKLSRFLEKRPPHMDYLVLDGNLKVLYSTIEDYTANEIVDRDEIVDTISNNGKAYMYQIDNPTTKRNIIVISRISRKNRKPPNFVTKMIPPVLIGFIILIIFCAVFLFILIKSITGPIMIFERSTKIIASGNFDEEIKVRGNNEIKSLADSLNKMRLALKDNMERRNRFIMGVSHDLRTPVALIKGYTEAISDGMVDDPEKKQKSLEIIITKATQLEEMINDLINFIKLDRGEWRKNLLPTDIKKTLENYCEQTVSDGQLLKRHLTYKIDLPDNTLVKFDEKLFIRVCENLVGNAFRYTKENGKVEIKAEIIEVGKDSEISLSIHDDGIGISKTDLPYIFDPFYRGTNSRREAGNGLGLSFVQSVVTSLGWTITVESEKNNGACFTIHIPV